MDAWLAPLTSLCYLALIMLILYWIARTWDRIGGNRYLTLGMPPRLILPRLAD